ncbi:kinase-like domain-containing protein [Rhizophagus irregularis DAOM 181602=DAOM 197198]|nr:kinase-like domain-containing protein [Rhizophagus irregularis DAOM 181602=DAOM 197198]
MENLEKNSRSWTSGNNKIDGFIREMQLEINDPSDTIFKWVPYNQFSNIKKIGNGDFAIAKWKCNQNDVTVNLKYLNNSQSITTYELRNEARQYSIRSSSNYYNICKIYGVSQNPYTKDYIFVLQDGYCKGCGENDIKKISNIIYSALWNDGQLKYNRNKKEWTRVQVEINLKLFNSQNTVDEFLNKVVEYKNDNFKIYGISQNPDTKNYIFVLQDRYCEECALWNNDQLKHDRNKKEWIRVQVEINLKLFNSQNTIDEFLNKVVEYKNDNFKIYGISQNLDTKDYILVLQTGYHCDECALWNDGKLKYDQNKKEWIRVQVEINLNHVIHKLQLMNFLIRF